MAQNNITAHPLLCIDIGGTYIRWASYDGDTTDPIHHIEKSLTQRGVFPLKNQIRQIVRSSIETLEKDQTLDIAIGTPGKLVNGIIQTGSAENLGTKPGEWDLFSWNAELQSISQVEEITVINDAIAQMIGGYHQLEPNHPELTNTKLAYIGPGTGLGGGFAHTKNGGLTPYSDGHIYDMLIRNKKAEDLISGTSLFNQTQHTGKAINKTSHLQKKYRHIVQEMGHYLATLIHQIHNGKIPKEKPENQWTETDIKQAKGTTHFLIGGSIGTQGWLGDTLLKTARGTLKNKTYPPSLSLYPIPHPDKAAIIGLQKQARNDMIKS